MKNSDETASTDKKLKIILVSGGTGGHLFPAIATAEYIKQNTQHTVILVTDGRGAKFLDQYQHSFADIIILKGRKQGSLRVLARNLFFSLKFLAQYRPHVVWGFGGAITVSPLVAAWILRIRRGIHQADCRWGRANKLLSFLCDKVSLAFNMYVPAPAHRQGQQQQHQQQGQQQQGQQQSPQHSGNNIQHSQQHGREVVTGNPVRQEIKQLQTRDYAPYTNGFFNLVVLGGSQGASIWSHIVPQAIAALPRELQQKIAVVQQCRKELLAQTQLLYKETVAQVLLLPFIDDIGKVLNTASLVLSRAGSSILAELSVAGLPVLWVPFAHATDDHQTINAGYAVAHGAGWILTEEILNSALLSAFIQEKMQNTDVLLSTAKASKQLNNPAADRILSELIISTCRV